jgi:hypothetical protein
MSTARRRLLLLPDCRIDRDACLAQWRGRYYYATSARGVFLPFRGCLLGENTEMATGRRGMPVPTYRNSVTIFFFSRTIHSE